MLRRHRQLRQRVHRWLDVSLFAIALWVAHLIRDVVPLDEYAGWIPGAGEWLKWKLADPILPFFEYVWLYFVIIPLVPVVLEGQGFYKRPLFFSRGQTAWALLKTSVIVTLSAILAIFLLNNQAVISRSVAILFGAVSFALVYLKEELIHWAYESKFGQAQIKTRLLLVGTKEDTLRLRKEISAKV